MKLSFYLKSHQKFFHLPQKLNRQLLNYLGERILNLNVMRIYFLKLLNFLFNKEEKKIKNSLKNLHLDINLIEDTIFDLRPENLNYKDFIELTQKIESKNVRI